MKGADGQQTPYRIRLPTTRQPHPSYPPLPSSPLLNVPSFSRKPASRTTCMIVCVVRGCVEGMRGAKMMRQRSGMPMSAGQSLWVGFIASSTTSLIYWTCSCVRVLRTRPRWSAAQPHRETQAAHDEARKKENGRTEEAFSCLHPSNPSPVHPTAHHSLRCGQEGTVRPCVVPVPGCGGITRMRA